jgi:hypothetical protein
MRSLWFCVALAGCFKPAPPAGLACGPNRWCPAPYSCNTAGFCGMSPTDAAIDTAQGDGDAMGARANFAFVTSTTAQMRVGFSTATADALCQSAADASPLPHDATYKAWFSQAADRDAVTVLGTSRGWVLPDGKPLVDTISDLTSLRFFYAFKEDESGADLTSIVGTDYFTTGTGSDGRDLSGEDCKSANVVSIGTPDAADARWTTYGNTTASCTVRSHFYCFEVGHQQPVHPPASTARHMFITRGDFQLNAQTSRDDLDALCNTEAVGSGLPGVGYLALVSSTLESASQRFTVDGVGWQRSDGVIVTKDFTSWLAAPNLESDGTTYRNTFIWTGASAPNVIGSSASTCNDWGDPTMVTAQLGESGRTTIAGLFNASNNGACSVPHPVLCFEP